MKKLISMLFVSSLSIMSSSAINADCSAKSDAEVEYIKTQNESTAYSKPYIDKRKFYVTEGGYDEKKEAIYLNKKNRYDGEAVRFQIPANGTTTICVARDGVVDEVHQNEEKKSHYANFIRIYHGDKTFSEYWYFKYKSAKVRVGQKVKAGQILAISENPDNMITPQVFFFVVYYLVKGKDNKIEGKPLPVHFMIDGKISPLKEGDMF